MISKKWLRKGVNGKSQSDTTIYAPAVAVQGKQNQTVVGASPNLVRRLDEKDKQQFNESMVADYLKRVRLNDFSGVNVEGALAGINEEPQPRGSKETTDEQPDRV